jgi:myo-inositol-1-phosphate synthase
MVITKQTKQLAHYKEARYTMSQIEIGQSFTTQKSGVSGTVQEIVKNANGSFRVRLDVAGQPRWTTVSSN